MSKALLVIVFAGSVGACGPSYVTAAMQPTWSVAGPLAPVIASHGGSQAASVGLGVGGPALGIEAAVHSIDVGAATFTAPAMPSGGAVLATASEDGRYATMHSTLEARWTAVRGRRLGLHVRGGVSRGVVVDKMTLERDWGIGYRAGLGIEVLVHKHLLVWIDASQTTLGFASGAAEGRSTLRGITLGVALGR